MFIRLGTHGSDGELSSTLNWRHFYVTKDTKKHSFVRPREISSHFFHFAKAERFIVEYHWLTVNFVIERAWVQSQLMTALFSSEVCCLRDCLSQKVDVHLKQETMGGKNVCFGKFWVWQIAVNKNKPVLLKQNITYLEAN